MRRNYRQLNADCQGQTFSDSVARASTARRSRGHSGRDASANLAALVPPPKPSRCPPNPSLATTCCSRSNVPSRSSASASGITDSPSLSPAAAHKFRQAVQVSRGRGAPRSERGHGDALVPNTSPSAPFRGKALGIEGRQVTGSGPERTIARLHVENAPARPTRSSPMATITNAAQVDIATR